MIAEELRLHMLDNIAQIKAHPLIWGQMTALQKAITLANEKVLTADDPAVAPYLQAICDCIDPLPYKETSVKVGNTPLTTLGIPQDVIDAATQIGMDAEALVQLCVAHSVEAARGFLDWIKNHLPLGG